MGGKALGHLAVHVGADRLVGSGKGGVATIHHGLRHQCDHRTVEPAPAHGVAERVLEHEADRALGIANGVGQTDGRHLTFGDLRPAQDEAHLRPVAMGDHHRPAGGDQVDDMVGRGDHRPVLVAQPTGFARADEGVAADGNHGDAALGHGVLSRSVARAVSASMNATSGAVVMPAPI